MGREEKKGREIYGRRGKVETVTNDETKTKEVRIVVDSVATLGSDPLTR